MRLSSYRVLSGAAWLYVWLIRGTPVLLQLVFLFDALPLVGIVMPPVTTAILGFALNEAAFSGEVIRGGILSVSRNQTLAAASLGMGSLLTLRRIVLPQAMRAILPAIGNDAISVLKGTSLASVIAVNELTLRSQQIVAQNFKFFPVFAAAGLMYLTVTTLISGIQYVLERRVSPDVDRRPPGERIGAGPPLRLPPRIRPAARPSRPPGPASRVAAPAGAAGAGARATWSSWSAAQAARTRPDEGGPFVSCRDVHKAYGHREHPAGRRADRPKRGEVVTLMGPSGSGKSTLLRLIAHLEPLDRGEIAVGGELVGYERVDGALRPSRHVARERARARIGMVFQQFNLFEHLTALENVCEAPVRVHGESPAAARDRGMKLLVERGPRPSRRSPARADVRRPAAAGGHRARARHLARGSCSSTSRPPRSIRSWSSDVLARHPAARRGGHDDDRRDPRGALRPRGGGSDRVHGRRPHRRAGHARRTSSSTRARRGPSSSSSSWGDA